MNSRERVLAALAHQRLDRTPRDFWAEDPSWNRFLSHSGHPDREAARRALGINLRLLDAEGPGDRDLGGGVFQNAWGERYVYQETGWGPMREDLPGALANARTLAELEQFPWPHPDQRDYGRLRNQCGSIRPFIADLIALGVDVLNPIQPTGLDMMPESLQAEYGGRVVFHGGIDMQRLLPHGQPEEVQAEARRYCAALGDRGGYILAPAHRFQPDFPPENILAMYAGAP